MESRRATFEAIGTRWVIEVNDIVGDDAWASLLKHIHSRVQSFDKTYSRFRADSLVTRMSQQAGEYELPPDGYKLLSFYEQLYRTTKSKVTPLIGQVVADAGYDGSYSFQTKKLQRPPRWEDVITYTESTITLNQACLLDFGAAGKGYLVDIIGDIFAQAKLKSYTINAGGDILHRSETNEAVSVGLENPLDTTEAVGIAQLHNKSLCASAGSKRAWGNFHHIIDPTELQSPHKTISTWVIANDTMTADGIATALFFTSPAELKKHFDFTFAILGKDMFLHHAPDFPVTIFEAAV